MTLKVPAAGSFDGLAEAYDRFRVGYAPELYEVLHDFGIARGARVLDVGCGTGIVARELVARGCTVTGVDVSQQMLSFAQERVPAARFLEAASEALPFATDSFDAATSAQAFHWFDQPRALAEMLRVVRPGGTVGVWWKRMMRGDAARVLRESVVNELGLPSLPELHKAEFSAFESAGLLERCLRVIPWAVRTTARDFVGYERSRARARDAFGGRLDEYIARLQARLGAPESELAITYVQLLYLGRVPGAG